MDFLVNNKDLFITISLVLGILGLGLVGIPFLKRKGYIEKDDTEFTIQLLELMKLLIYELNLGNEKVKENTMIVFKIAEITVNYIDKNMDLNGQNIEDVSYETAIELLEELDIEITEERKKMIKLGIKFAVNNLRSD